MVPMARKITSRRSRAHGIRFTAQVWKEGSAYIAYSPELDLSSVGGSTMQARTRLREAVALFLEEAARKGSLTEILSEAGFESREILTIAIAFSSAKQSVWPCPQPYSQACDASPDPSFLFKDYPRA